jgi:hypothetical protein
MTSLPMVQLHLDCTVSPVEAGDVRLLLEFRPIDQQLQGGAGGTTAPAAASKPRADPQPGARDQESARRHTRIGATARARARPPELREYTQVIINEADRLQDLMNRLLTSHRRCSRRRSTCTKSRARAQLILRGVRQREGARDYDTSLPDLTGDREQLIQAVLNIARNAAQAMQGEGASSSGRAPVRAGDAGQEALSPGTGIASDRQRPRHSGRHPRQASSTRWCPAARAAAARAHAGAELRAAAPRNDRSAIAGPAGPASPSACRCPSNGRTRDIEDHESSLDHRRRPFHPLGAREGTRAGGDPVQEPFQYGGDAL